MAQRALSSGVRGAFAAEAIAAWCRAGVALAAGVAVAWLASMLDATARAESTPRATRPTLDGTWSSSCDLEPNGRGGEMRVVRTFSSKGKRWTTELSVYDDDACDAAHVQYVVHLDGRVRWGKAVAAPAGAFALDLLFAHRSITPRAAGVAKLNGEKLCELDGWVADQPREVQKLGCPTLGMYPLADCKGDFDLVRQDESDLVFGQRAVDGNLCSAEQRPTALQLHLHKQR